jgi:hypothetical protein
MMPGCILTCRGSGYFDRRFLSCRGADGAAVGQGPLLTSPGREENEG